MHRYSSEAHELIKMAYADGCTTRNIVDIFANLGIEMPMSTITNYKPDIHKQRLKHMAEYRKRPVVRARLRRYMQLPQVRKQIKMQKEIRYKRLWEGKKETAARYTLTPYYFDILEKRNPENAFKDNGILMILNHLKKEPANEYELVDYLRKIGFYCSTNGRFPHFNLVKKALNHLQKKGFVQLLPVCQIENQRLG